MFGKKSKKIKELQVEVAILKDKNGMLERDKADLAESNFKLKTARDELSFSVTQLQKEIDALKDKERQRFQARSEAAKKAAETKKKTSKN